MRYCLDATTKKKVDTMSKTPTEAQVRQRVRNVALGYVKEFASAGHKVSIDATKDGCVLYAEQDDKTIAFKLSVVDLGPEVKCPQKRLAEWSDTPLDLDEEAMSHA